LLLQDVDDGIRSEFTDLVAIGQLAEQINQHDSCQYRVDVCNQVGFVLLTRQEVFDCFKKAFNLTLTEFFDEWLKSVDA